MALIPLNNLPRRISSRQGYTLVEVVFVAAIIAILVLGVWECVNDVKDWVRIREAEMLIEDLARYAIAAEKPVRTNCDSWDTPGPSGGTGKIGVTHRAWAGMMVGEYSIKADGEVRCAYALCRQDNDSGEDETDIHDGPLWALAACDVNGDGVFRYYVRFADNFDIDGRPAATDGVLGCTDAKVPDDDSDTGDEGKAPPLSPATLVEMAASRPISGDGDPTTQIVKKKNLPRVY